MSTSQPDVRLLAQEEIPQGAFPSRGGEELRVHFAPAAHEQAWQHATTNKSVEICGILVGVWRRDADGPFVDVRHIIPCDAAKSAQAEVTFTHEAWGKINQEMDTKYAELRIVGWYHSHPDFGIFLSDRDVFIHQHFFSGAGQIALVVDPIRRVEGVFCWRAGKPTMMSHYWVGSKLLIRPAEAAPPLHATSAALSGGTAEPPDSRRRPGDVGEKASILSSVGLLLLGGLISYVFTTWADFRREQAYQESLVLKFFQARVLRVGLEDHLEAARQDLTQLNDRLAQIAKPAAADGKSSDSESTKTRTEDWKVVREEIVRLGENLNAMQRKYALSPHEQSTLMRLLTAAQTMQERETRKDAKSKPGESGPPKKSPSAVEGEEGDSADAKFSGLTAPRGKKRDSTKEGGPDAGSKTSAEAESSQKTER